MDRGMGLMGMLRKDGSAIFYQIQHRCDLTLGQGYSTSQKKVKCALKWVPLGYLDALVSTCSNELMAQWLCVQFVCEKYCAF
jgi:hypothetical protein